MGHFLFVPFLPVASWAIRNPFNPQLLISHLTYSNGCGNLYPRFRLTVSPFLSCPRSAITVSPQPTKSHSLQAIYFQYNTHSFPQRRQPIPRSFNHLRTLLPLTANIFSHSHFFSPTPLFLITSLQRLHFHAIPHSSAQRRSGIPSVLNILLSRHYLAYLSPRYTLNPRRFNLLQPLFQKHPGWGTGLRVHSPLATRHSPLAT